MQVASSVNHLFVAVQVHSDVIIHLETVKNRCKSVKTHIGDIKNESRLSQRIFSVSCLQRKGLVGMRSFDKKIRKNVQYFVVFH